MISRAKQLASIAAAGASAVVLTGGKAEAGIIYSGILDTASGFTSNSYDGHAGVSSHVFNSFAGGARLRS